MPQGPEKKRPLPTVLQELSLDKFGLVLVKGKDYYRIEQVAGQARREAKSGHPDVRRYLSAYEFWWDVDPDGKVVIFRDTPLGPEVISAEVGSRSIPLALDEGDWGGEMLLSGSLGRVAKAFLGKPMEARTIDLVKGPQFETYVDGTHFIVVYTKHFVDRYVYDHENRPAVARFMDGEMIREEIEKALPQIKDMLEADPYAQGIIVSKPYGLSMKFFATPIDDGWQLNFATQIIALPLWRTSDREVEIVVNPVVDVRFDDAVPEDLQITLLADLGPQLMDLAPGEEETLSGELVSALIRHGVEGFSVQSVEWKDAWEPLYV